jgi:iron complex transport system ATP-binding protein
MVADKGAGMIHNASSPVLAVNDLTLVAGEKTLVGHVSWQVNAGEFWCIVGKNGAGKSTLLHTIAGLSLPRHGTVIANGAHAASLSAREQAQWRGLMLQTQPDVFASSVRDAVLTGRYPYQTGWGWENAEDIALVQAALQQVGLADYDNKNILHLSGGERQRVALATLLVQNPQLMLLDEPTAHQDVAAQIVVMELIRELSSRRAVVAVCHDLNLVARYATHVLVIASGQCHAGRVDEILQPSVLEAAFDCTFDVVDTVRGRLFVPAGTR